MGKKSQNHKPKADFSAEFAPLTIGKMKRQQGLGDRRDFLEKICTEMDEGHYTPGQMVKILRKRAREALKDKNAKSPISRSQLSKVYRVWKVNPRKAVRDMRSYNKRKAAELTEEQKRALDLVMGHHSEYDSGFPDAILTLQENLEGLGLKPEDLPKQWRCYDEWSRKSELEKKAHGTDYKALFEKMGFWTHGRKLAVDEEHNFDEGKLTLSKYLRLPNGQKVRVVFCLQVDVATWVIRGHLHLWREFRERDQVHCLKRALSPDLETGFKYGCIPHLIKCDRGSTHSTLSMRMADEWLRNRKGRQGKIVLNPQGQFWADASVERAIGETKRKFWRKVRRDFTDYMREQDLKVLDAETVEEALKRIGPKFTAFVRRHNQGKARKADLSRIERYEKESPKESKEVTIEEINKNVLYIEKGVLTNNGAFIDGRYYDVKKHYVYRNRSDTYIGVPPEGNSDFAVLFTMNDTGVLKRITELECTDTSTTVSLDKQACFVEDFGVAAKTNDAQRERWRDARRQLDELEKQREAAKLAEKEAAKGPVAKPKRTKPSPPTHSIDDKPQPPAPLPARPIIQTLKAA